MRRSLCCFALLLSLGLAGAATGVIPDSATADAAPSFSPLEGQYAWGIWSIKVGGHGAVDGSYKYTSTETYGHRKFTTTYSGTIRGDVTDGGDMTISTDESQDDGKYKFSWHWDMTATMALDTEGNMTGTTSAPVIATSSDGSTWTYLPAGYTFTFVRM